MIYVIDTCERFNEDRRMFFVEAPESFGEWFSTKLQTWQKELIKKLGGEAWFQVHQIVCVAPTATFPGKTQPISVDDYLKKNSFSPLKLREGAPSFQGEGLSPC